MMHVLSNSSHVKREESTVVNKKFYPYLSVSQGDLSGHEDEEHGFWFDHT